MFEQHSKVLFVSIVILSLLTFMFGETPPPDSMNWGNPPARGTQDV